MKYIPLFLLVLILGCGSPQKEIVHPDNRDLIHELNENLTHVVSEDVFSPPVASRIYAYTQVAAYEAFRYLDPAFASLSGQLNGLTLPEPPGDNPIKWEVAGIQAFCEVARHLVYRDHLIDSAEVNIMEKWQYHKLPPETLNASIAQGASLAQHIIQWIDKDQYRETRNMPRYETLGQPNTWEPTGPTYGEALEPHWPKIRPFTMDSTSQFRSPPPPEFSIEQTSGFYEGARRIHRLVNQTQDSDIDIAIYWDCNPGPTMVDGHVMKVRKQNTPGGHWVGIHRIACKKRELSLVEASGISAQLAVGIADGFMAAWDTKFAYNLIRPETYINRHIDPDWRPKLESPLFPEYSSAHSLISAVSASVLTHYHGEDFPFTDTTNVNFGLPPRSFSSFWEAAEEAANSRILGGIHYQFGCDEGLRQGRELGKWVLEKIILKPKPGAK